MHLLHTFPPHFHKTHYNIILSSTPRSTHFRLVPRSKNEWSYTPAPPICPMAWCSAKAQGQFYLYLTLSSSRGLSSLQVSQPNVVCISNLSHACHMSRSSRPTSLDHPNNVWWSVQVMKLLIMQSSPAFHHFLHLRSQYSPQHPVPLVWENKFHIHTKQIKLWLCTTCRRR
jgi:hypothetical protein